MKTAVDHPDKRISVAAVIGVIMAILGLAMNLLILRSGASGASDKFYRICAVVSTPLDLLLLTASVAALLFRSWHRLLYAWAVLACLYAVWRLVWAIIVVAPATTAEARVVLAGKPPGEFGPEFAGMMTTAIAAAVFVLVPFFRPCPLIKVPFLRPRNPDPQNTPARRGIT